MRLEGDENENAEMKESNGGTIGFGKKSIRTSTANRGLCCC